MGYEKNAASLRKISTFLIFIAIFMCSIQSGGLMWQHCIIPATLLCIAVIFNKFKSSGIVTDILIFVSLTACVFSIFLTKSDMMSAIHEGSKYICFVLAFYASVSVSKKNIYTAISVLGVFIAISGLLAYCNIIRLPELVFNDRGILRLQSFIKYANTTAVFLGASYFSLCGIKIQNRKLSGFLKMVLLSALYLTVSKAAIPIFLCIGIFYMIKRQDSDFLIHNAVCFLFVIPSIYLASHKMFAQCMLVIILWIILGGVLSGRLRYSKKLSVLCIFAACVVTAVASALMISGKYDIFSTFAYRLKYMKDALRLFSGSPFGNGPASWQLMQFGVQQEQYSVAYVHNGWLQFLIENGIVFFASFIIIIAISAYRMLKSKNAEGFSVLLLIAIHSLMDINFGFCVILILLGMLCGCEAPSRKASIMPILVFSLCIASVIYNSADYVTRSGFEKAYISENNELALKNAYRLEKLCPSDGTIQINIALLSGENMKKRLEKAMDLSPYDQGIVQRYAQYLISNQDKKAFTYLEKLMDMAPMQESTYTTVRQLAQQALIYNVVTEEEYNSFMTETDSVMKQNNVTDRNKQLENITK